MRKVLLDTDVTIWLLKKKECYVQTFIAARKEGYEFLLSPIVSAEVYTGAFKHEYPTIEQFFSLLTQLTLDTETGKLAGEYANQYRKAYNKISLEDYLLAATAVQEKAWLWTDNQKHYPMPEAHFFHNGFLSTITSSV
jgi:predicted nucleic acid-binding protein